MILVVGLEVNPSDPNVDNKMVEGVLNAPGFLVVWCLGCVNRGDLKIYENPSSQTK